jgi:hypothetical protein
LDDTLQATPRIKYLLHTKYLYSTFTGKYMTALILSLFQLTQADSKVSENFHNTNFTVPTQNWTQRLVPVSSGLHNTLFL